MPSGEFCMLANTILCSELTLWHTQLGHCIRAIHRLAEPQSYPQRTTVLRIFHQLRHAQYYTGMHKAKVGRRPRQCSRAHRQMCALRVSVNLRPQGTPTVRQSGRFRKLNQDVGANQDGTGCAIRMATNQEGSMTKKHFISMARDIAASDQTPEAKTFAALVIIRTAQEDNPRFDRARFLKACGLAQ